MATKKMLNGQISSQTGKNHRIYINIFMNSTWVGHRLMAQPLTIYQDNHTCTVVSTRDSDSETDTVSKRVP